MTADEMVTQMRKEMQEEKCPTCGGKAGKWGSGTCSGKCWADLYGEE